MTLSKAYPQSTSWFKHSDLVEDSRTHESRGPRFKSCLGALVSFSMTRLLSNQSSPAEPSVDLDLEYIENVFTYLER